MCYLKTMDKFKPLSQMTDKELDEMAVMADLYCSSIGDDLFEESMDEDYDLNPMIDDEGYLW